MRYASLVVPLVTVVGCAKPPPPEPEPAPGPPVAEPVEPAEPVELEKLLVMPLRPETGLEESSRALDEMILVAIHDLEKYEVLGPEDLNAVLGVEAMRDAMGCDDVACAAEIGGALGAPYLVAGQLTKLGEQTVLSLRLMDTQAPAVLERSTARGPATADALATMMAAAIGDLFHANVEDTGPTVAAPPPPEAPTHTDYTTLVNELTRLSSNNDFTGLLERVDHTDPGTIDVPAGVDLKEILVYYRMFACSRLKNVKCVRNTARVYQKLWPAGRYAAAVQAYLDEVLTNETLRAEQSSNIDAKLAEFRAMVKAGTMTPLEGKEAAAYTLFGGRRYPEAAALYTELVKAHRSHPDKAMDLVSMLALSLEYAGEVAKARQILEEARRRHPRLFRLKGLHDRLRNLPR